MATFHFRPARRTPSPGPSTIVVYPATLGLSIVAGASLTYLSDTVLVSNGTTNPTAGFVVSDDAAWLTFASDVATNGDVTLTLSVDASALSAGSYVGTITAVDVRASNSPQTITVDLTVTSATATIGLTPASVAVFLADEAVGGVQSVLISPLGTLPLATPTIGTITYGGGATGWVTSPAIVDNGDGTFTLNFTPTAVGGTVGGPYTASIPIVSAGASNTPLALPVALTVTAGAAANLVLDRNLDDMSGTAGGANPAAQTVGIRSSNTTPLSGPIISAPTYGGSFTGWATASLSGNTLSITPDITGLLTGSGYVDYTISDGAASNTVVYRVVLKISQATFPPALRASPTGVSAAATVGSNPVTQVVTISNGGSGGLAALGVVTVGFVGTQTWCTPSYDAGTGALTLTFNASALSANTYADTLRVSATLTSVPYIDIPVVLVMSAVPAGTWPQPPAELQLAAGYTWDVDEGYPVGSVFNVGGPAGCANGARPTFSGATHQIPETYATWGAAKTAIEAGTIVPGDIISIRADQVITDAQVPVITGRVLTDTPICVQSRNMANLPAHSYDSGPDSYGVDNRGGKDAHLPYMPIFKTTTLNRSVLSFQQGGGGFWFEGVQFWADTTAVTQAIMSLKGHNGHTPAHSQAAHIPSGIVFDRCRWRSTNGHQNVLEGDARYLRITHCTGDYARRPGTQNDNNENKFAYFISTDGKIEILGNQFSSLGITILVGGSDPTIQHINPSDGMVLWNRVPNVALANNQLDGDDDKNLFENKTGRRWFWGFNRATDLCGRQDQKFFGLSKSVDTNGGNNFIAHSTDQMWWCNYVDGAKGLFGVAPRTVASTSALDSERLYSMYNLCLGIWDTDHWPTWKRNSPGSPLWTINVGDRTGMQITKSQGQGINTVKVRHNTFGSMNVQGVLTNLEDQTFLELDSISLGVWASIEIDDNVMIAKPKYGPFKGNQNSNTGGMNGVFGPGNWSARRNLIMPGGALWDATLAGAGFNNGYLLSGGPSVNFVNPVRGLLANYSLVPGHPAKGTSFWTPGGDPGYNHDYMTAMLSTVLTNDGL